MPSYKNKAFIGFIALTAILLLALSSFAGTSLYTYDSLYRLTAVEYGGWTKAVKS